MSAAGRAGAPVAGAGGEACWCGEPADSEVQPVSCCDPEPDEDAPTVRHLIHDMSSYWIDQGKPVYVDFIDTTGTLHLFMVTGITSMARGQSFELKPVESVT